jgi:hypothetical protein
MCPPFLESTTPEISETFESEIFAGMCFASIDKWSFEPRVDKKIFQNGLKTWFANEAKLAEQSNASRVVLKHPLSAFLLDEICRVVDPIFVVVTRPFDKIEETRVSQGWPENEGRLGAQAIYDQIYSFLHEQEKSFFTISIKEFMDVRQSRLQLLDYCDLDVTDSAADIAFRHVTNRN